MNDPLSALIDEAPTSAQFLTDPDETDYDPDAALPHEPNPDPILAGPVIYGLFSKQVDESLDGNASATLSVKPADMPDSYVAGKSRVQVGGEIYIVMSHRTRRWLEDINGYTLRLQL